MGSRKGIPNHSSARVKAAFAAFVEGNLPKMQDKFDAIEDPKEWFDCLSKMAAFCVPKPTEISGPDGEPLKITIQRITLDKE
jgi:hypothetical protein